MIELAWPFAAATALCTLLALVIHTRVRGFLPEDSPGPARKRHARPTPMAGTIPAAVAVVACGLAQAWWLGGACALGACVGLLDDLRKSHGRDGLGWRMKAIGLAGAATLGTLAIRQPDTALPHFCLLAAGLFCLVNAFNFLDNQDGVATSLGVVALGALAWRGDHDLALPLCAAFLAFLPFNWPRPHLFLGDAGAYALGMCAATLTFRPLAAGPDPDWLHALTPVALPVIDFTQVVAVRLALGYAPWKGDRRHLTHLLLLLGIPSRALAPLLATLALAALTL